jgi:hypothetical protein
LVDLRALLPGAKRRRRKPRADAPKTIVPPREAAPADRFDAAKARLRAQIPPRSDETA